MVQTEHIRPLIVNEAQSTATAKKVPTTSKFIPKIFKSSTISSLAITKPMGQLDSKKNKNNEIFVDIFEKLTCLFNANGMVINSSIDGVI